MVILSLSLFSFFLSNKFNNPTKNILATDHIEIYRYTLMTQQGPLEIENYSKIVVKRGVGVCACKTKWLYQKACIVLSMKSNHLSSC